MTPEQRRLSDDIGKRGTPNAEHKRVWIEELADVVTRVDDGRRQPSWLEVRLFWIRLHGVVSELVDAERPIAELARTLPPERLRTNLMQFSLAMFEAAERIAGLLDAEELVTVDYLRQRAAHLHQRGYALQQAKTGLKETRTFKHLGETLTIEQLDEMIPRTIATSGGEEAFAVTVARRIKDEVFRLRDVVQALHALPRM